MGKSRWDSVKGSHNRLKEVEITLFEGKEFRDFNKWPLYTRCPLNTVPRNTGLTVFRVLIPCYENNIIMYYNIFG